MFCLTLFVILCTFNDAISHHDGAPCEALNDMAPAIFAHGAASIEPIPYEIIILTTITEQPADCYRENREYLIRIKPKNAAQSFAGFLLQARSVANKRTGNFVTNSGDSQAWKLQCSDTINSVTHTSSAPKNKLDINWITKTDVGSVTFQATVVKSQYEWWNGVLSKPFKSCRSDFAANIDPRSGTAKPKSHHCEDNLPSCSSWSHLCSIHAFVFSYCRETCNRCAYDL